MSDPSHLPPDPGRSPLAPGDLLAGRYRIEHVLGQGGGGTVYAARHVELGKPVAIKLLRAELSALPEFRARFEREARVCSRLAHPGAVDVHDFGSHEGRLFLVMDRLSGHALRKDLDTGAPLALPRALALGLQIADVLAVAHEIPLVHRDIKPENVILEPTLTGGERAVLVDFGLAFIPDAAGLGRMTADGLVSGTPSYLSPEQARGVDVGPPSDLYSFGCTLFEMVTGQAPFAGQPMELVSQHMFVPAPALRSTRPDLELPEALEALVAEMLLKHAGHRPGAAEVRERLGEIASGTAPHPRSKMPKTRASRMVEAVDPDLRVTAPALSQAEVVVLGDAASDPALVLACASNGIHLVAGAGAASAGFAQAVEGAEAIFAPEASAEEVARLVASGLPVIAGARKGDLARLTPLLRAGAVEIVGLPLGADDVVQKLARVLRQRRRTRPSGPQES